MSLAREEISMRKFKDAARCFFRDEKAAEVTELGIVLALIVALAILAIQSIGGKVSDAYSTVDNALPASGS
jgi:Flp pilus assembly pilin Flp